MNSVKRTAGTGWSLEVSQALTSWKLRWMLYQLTAPRSGKNDLESSTHLGLKNVKSPGTSFMDLNGWPWSI
jgi:hypothetical protein